MTGSASYFNRMLLGTVVKTEKRNEEGSREPPDEDWVSIQVRGHGAQTWDLRVVRCG